METSPAESEEQMEDDVIDDNAGLLLGGWFKRPRWSRQVAGLHPIDSSAEVTCDE